MDISKEREFYETDDISIVSIGPAAEIRYISTSAYPYVENLIKLVISCSKIAIYYHDDELLKVLQKEPDKIVNFVTESEQILPGEYLFLKRLKMMILSMISVSNPSTNYYSLE